MKNIAVLIDFTEGSKVALKQAAQLAKKIDAKVYGLHIVSTQQKVEGAAAQLLQFFKEQGVEADPQVSVGSLNTATQEGLKKVRPDLVVVCTHGIKGMFQHLFGAQILKLVQSIPYPCLVIHENCTTDLANTQKMLFPIGPHPDYKQAGAFAKVLNATLVIYEIDRPGGVYEDLLAQNLELATSYFDEHQINYTKVIEEAKFVSVGYSRQTIEYASSNTIPIISLMASVSKNEELFGLGDKENFLVNEQGVSVLTCNM
jgi:nucleotide-binding universal stress UspA family protein